MSLNLRARNATEFAIIAFFALLDPVLVVGIVAICTSLWNRNYAEVPLDGSSLMFGICLYTRLTNLIALEPLHLLPFLKIHLQF